jgi:hypothetical protein
MNRPFHFSKNYEPTLHLREQTPNYNSNGNGILPPIFYAEVAERLSVLCKYDHVVHPVARVKRA